MDLEWDTLMLPLLREPDEGAIQECAESRADTGKRRRGPRPHLTD